MGVFEVMVARRLAELLDVNGGRELLAPLEIEDLAADVGEPKEPERDVGHWPRDHRAGWTCIA